MKPKEPLYIFIHLMRCAGTTIREHIKNNIPKEETLFLYGHPANQLPTVESVHKGVLSLSEEQRSKIRIIFGHKAYYGIHELFPGREARYVTFLRDPVDRSISEYNYHRTINKTGMAKNTVFDGENALSFEESFMQKPRFHNHMFKHLFGHILYFNIDRNGRFDNVPPKYINRKNLEKLKEILNNFYFVGITENKKDFELFYRMAGIPDKHIDKNASEKHFIPQDYESIKRLILPKLVFDKELYEHAIMLNKRFKEKNYIT